MGDLSVKKNIVTKAVIPGILVCVLLPPDTASAQELASFSSALFAGSGDCMFCHASGTNVLTTQKGEDVSPPTAWRSTMMANASKDPYWRAKVAAEVSVHPNLAGAIEDKCATCHAPMGRTEAVYSGSTGYSLSSLSDDLPGLDGVSCTVCHQIRDANLGTKDGFSGKYVITDSREIFGPYTEPLTAQMRNQVNYTPMYSSHVERSELCAVCHTLYTSYVDKDGNLTGAFPEQVPYLEWSNSVYPARGISCQTCHMPEVEESMRISLRPPWLETQREPIWRHDFAGGNIFLTSILSANRDELGVTATSGHFDYTTGKAKSMLETRTLDLTADAFFTGDTLAVDVALKNLTGHKFPTGFPSRRAWIRLSVRGDDGSTVFDSGNWDETNEIIGLDASFDTHHDYIYDESDVQVYEPVMADDTGGITYTLLKAAVYLKDNRLPPQGFTSSASGYADMSIAGDADDDPDFNRTDGVEGSGADIVHYRIPLTDGGSLYTVDAAVYYQTVPPRFAADLFSHDGGTIGAFRTYYDASDNTPVPVKSVSTEVLRTSVNDQEAEKPADFALYQNHPNPFNGETRIGFSIAEDDNITLTIYNILGQEVAKPVDAFLTRGVYEVTWSGNSEKKTVDSGVYLYELRAGNRRETKKLTILE